MLGAERDVVFFVPISRLRRLHFYGARFLCSAAVFVCSRLTFLCFRVALERVRLRFLISRPTLLSYYGSLLISRTSFRDVSATLLGRQSASAPARRVAHVRNLIAPFQTEVRIGSRNARSCARRVRCVLRDVHHLAPLARPARGRCRWLHVPTHRCHVAQANKRSPARGFAPQRLTRKRAAGRCRTADTGGARLPCTPAYAPARPVTRMLQVDHARNDDCISRGLAHSSARLADYAFLAILAIMRAAG
jgi:hypothetical protein